MAKEWFQLDISQASEIEKRIAQYGAGSGQVIDKVLHTEGAEIIKDRITPLIPRSGRKWKKKGRAAADAMPRAFSQDNGQLSVTIAARGKYHYLYFPDDGSNTRRHAGGQGFMYRGASNASEKIVDICVERLIENFNGGN